MSSVTNRAAARQAVRSQYYFVANEEEAFSVFGRQEVQDVNRIRQVTDVPYLILFILVIIGMIVLEVDSVRYGNVLRLSEPIDFKGRLCGYDEEVKSTPLGYHPNPLNDMIVCVSACPKTAADGNFTLPDGPMGKYHTRSAYPTAQIFGQQCLPLDLSLAKLIISVKSVQTEAYKALGIIFTATDVVLLVLLVPFITSLIYIIALYVVPTATTAAAFTTTGITLALIAFIMDLDLEVMGGIPLFTETHPIMLASHPTMRASCYIGALIFLGMIPITLHDMQRAHAVYKECMTAIMDPNVMVTIVASMVLSVARIYFILHVCKVLALLMSIVNPVEVQLQLFGESHFVRRNAWSPFFLKGTFFYCFGAFWVLEFMSFCNKYVTAQILCQNYFYLRARNAQGFELRSGKTAPIWYALYSMFRYHLGSTAKAALLSFPCRSIRAFILIFVPDRPNLHASLNQQFRIAYYLFWPLIQFDLRYLRFFKDTVMVMSALKGYKYMEAARRVEGLLNRSRGKIPHLNKFTARTDAMLNISVGLTSMIWAFFLFREPRHGRYHEVEHLAMRESVEGIFRTPEHSPLLAMPVLLFFGQWVGGGMLHLVSMSSCTLTVCYCIDVEMAGGTETDALYVPSSLKETYKDLGGGESERELAELMANRPMGM
eukprot:TRINITY_DN46151_c0_g1_i1.p1 TRINITY_DN46151_c0_g1~~TRINITY_DN46151_c0_g1_i1.p1  ORF type:complete len:657 (-),score=85.06 TRINITY_DN46151_c0_g1_i1:55-2025(-)